MTTPDVHTLGQLAFTSLDVDDVLRWREEGVTVDVMAQRKACKAWHVRQMLALGPNRERRRLRRALSSVAETIDALHHSGGTDLDDVLGQAEELRAAIVAKLEELAA